MKYVLSLKSWRWIMYLNDQFLFPTHTSLYHPLLNP